ncbi:MAG: LD-carboxypeptidase, partial [Bacteroidales bacterium]
DSAAASLSGLGFKVTFGKHLFSRFHQFAGTDDERAGDFREALNDSNVRAVFCARGGYGSLRIIDKIDFSPFGKDPKWVIGFSDITVFHSLLCQAFHAVTIHAPMPINSESDHFSNNLEQLNDLLLGRKNGIVFPHHPLNRKGLANGRIMGGNLSIIHNLQATPYELDTNDTILFIEEVGEQLYHLDRMMTNLLLSGKLKNLKGLIVGGMTEMKDKRTSFGKTACEIVLEAASSFDYPVAFGFPAGHMESNVPFLLGTQIELKVTDSESSVKYVS